MTKEDKFDLSIIPKEWRSRPFSDPACREGEGFFFDYFSMLLDSGQLPITKFALARVGDSLFPTTICKVIQKPHEFGHPTSLVVESSDQRLIGCILTTSHRSIRPLYRNAKYYKKVMINPSIEAMKIVEKNGLLIGLLTILSALKVNISDSFQANVNKFSNWVDENRSVHVERTWR
ncbi:hypothetical protein KBD69_00225 [Candidatus Woesebacteria bacterium]|nr:hypothetical protein [Candidatus Woesebacteria bacterium]